MNIAISLEHDQMFISHAEMNEKAFYDVCDIDGKILLTGRLENEQKQTQIPLSSISKGKYNVFVINGGEVFKQIISYN